MEKDIRTQVASGRVQTEKDTGTFQDDESTLS